jgi:hypothetical protein
MDQLQPSPEVLEPFSRIMEEGKESNFFSSMVFESSAEKKEPKIS